MSYQITRRFQFCAGHRVWKHESKCNYIHGHNYVLYVTVENSELDSIGRVIDFGEVKKLIGNWIDENWDHNFIVNKNDPLVKDVSQYCKNGQAYLLDENPTAEVMAQHIMAMAHILLPKNIKPVKVQLWETENCHAEIENK